MLDNDLKVACNVTCQHKPSWPRVLFRSESNLIAISH